jgi:transcriptional regulator with XRE-family HTH domain
MQSIGERLEEARKRKGISIREAAEATKIRGDYLHKFENNQFDIKLPEIYVRGFLRTYATFLKAPADKIINDYKGLGLDENKGVRGLNRETYGRMDLTVGSKMDKEPGDGAAAAPAITGEPVATNADAGPRNPATFVPPRPASGGRTPIDRDLIMKAGILVGIAAVVVILGIWLLGGRGSKPAATTIAASSTEPNWTKPLAGEPVLSLVATGPVAVTVTIKADNTILYKGTIPRGDRRDIPRRGELRVVADPYQSLVFEIGGKRYPAAGQASEISPP